MSSVRVRFAPSPTGALHVGSARTALYNFLFARRHGGTFILRVEDTDRERLDPASLDSITGGLSWLGILWDEGPVFQSERAALYREHAAQLERAGLAYRCGCPPDELERLRESGVRGYDRRCRDNPPPAGARCALRLKVPTDGETTFRDELRGEITFANAELEDIVLMKSDGFPTYHLANVVDDHLMGVTHVMRADEWLPSTTYHRLLYEALDWEPPAFVHLPVILSPEGRKLSKRHGAVSVEDYREKGYLPEALVNYLALLGWSPGDDREIMSLDEMIEAFDLARVNLRGAEFDVAKLSWMNGEYLRRDERLAERLAPFMAAGVGDEAVARRAAALHAQRARTLTDVVEAARYMWDDDFPLDDRCREVLDAAALERLTALQADLAELTTWDEASVESCVRTKAAALDVKAAALIHPLRAALTGKSVGPSLFALVADLGKERTLHLMERARARVTP